MQVAFTTRKTSAFFSNKDKVPCGLCSNVIYKFTCEQCTNCSYVGETTRHLATRINEHLTGKPTPTEISLHTHVAKESNFEILYKSRYTKITESLVLSLMKSKHQLLNDIEKSYPLKLFASLL